MALFRPLVEAVVRSDWILRCATEQEFTGICNRTCSFPKFKVMADALDKEHARFDYAKKPYFSSFTGDAFFVMSGYAHTGVEQLVHRIDPDGTIGPAYKESHMIRLLKKSKELTLRHFALLAHARGFEDVTKELLNLPVDF